MRDVAYEGASNELTHEYGRHVRILSDPWALRMMALLSSPAVNGQQFHRLLSRAYQRLSQSIATSLQQSTQSMPTRMEQVVSGAASSGTMIEPRQQVVIADVARAGMVPAHVMQLEMMDVIDSDCVRVDHIYMQRIADEAGRVTGVETFGSKIGGPVTDATVIVPDPMGATGSSMSHVLKWYRDGMGTAPSRLITAHLIVTPEYIRRITDEVPEAEIFALRLDRGLSSEEVLQCVPGARWEEEVGLTLTDYIVPGAGGLGELINNAFV